ncbi:MAG: transposase [Candidatus Accumulibacter sp.]|nr:transposase [Accumulibacter sp.]
MEVQGGKAIAGKYSRPRLRLLLERLAVEERPVLVRGDIAFGNEGMMAEMEEIGQRYLFKLANGWGQAPDRAALAAQRLAGVGQGFDAVEAELQLAGWTRARRVVVLRRRVKSSLVAEASNESTQPELQFLDHSERAKLWEYAVLVTNADYSTEAMGQLYRDRADCENGFDELKINGAGAATPRRTWSAATSRRERWR